MSKPLEVPDVATKHQPKWNLEILKEFPDLTNWLKEISRFGKFEDFIFISDYKQGQIRLKIFTKEHYYSLRAQLPDSGESITKDSDNMLQPRSGDNGYLGCASSVRKSRAGEDWLRGNDLADGSYSERTWQRIKNNIIAYELVKVVRNSSDIDER